MLIEVHKVDESGCAHVTSDNGSVSMLRGSDSQSEHCTHTRSQAGPAAVMTRKNVRCKSRTKPRLERN